MSIQQNTDDLIVNVSVRTLLRYCNPIEDFCWPELVSPISPDEVFEFSDNNPYLEENTKKESLTRRDHIHKIAYFLQNEAKKPISIDVGIPGMCYISWFIADGNHRFYAAILNGCAFIKAEVSGSIEYAEKLGILS